MTSTIIGNAAERTCTQCDVVKPLTEFRIRLDGKGSRYPVRNCKPCEQVNRRARYAKHTQTPERAVSDEITALIRATTGRCTGPKAPLPTAQAMRDWYYDEKCRVRAKDRERTL